MIDVTLACEDGNSKLVEVVAVVDIDDKILKLLGSGPDMAAELKDGDRIEGGPEGGLPQRSFGGQAAEFWGISLLGRRCLEGGGDGFKDLLAAI